MSRDSTFLSLEDCRFELLCDEGEFLGLGKIWVGDTLVRSGRLPIRVYSESFSGVETGRMALQDVLVSDAELRIVMNVAFEPCETRLMKDHSLDPIHFTGDWDSGSPAPAGGTLTLVIRPATDSFNGVDFRGFAYHYEYYSLTNPLFFLLEKSSWELDGDINAATVYSQSACSDPAVKMEADTFWTTEGELFFLDQSAHHNRVMTHNLPRWADHQAFDFQHKGNRTLIGVFNAVELIRTVLRREPGKAELKCFDKHIFDETLCWSTPDKKILLNTDPKTIVDQQNVWTWIFDEVHRRARAEFGINETPIIPYLGHHYWSDFTIDTYYKDVVPACAAIGLKLIFAENFKNSDASEVPPVESGNMCLSQEYSIAESKGGITKFKEYIERCHRYGIKNHLWTNTYVSTRAKMNREHRCTSDSWYLAMEDTRTKYGGAYTNVASNLDFNNPAARHYYVYSHRRLLQESGLDGYFIDSFYNLFYMPLDYKSGHPRTTWRAALQVIRELQTAGAEFSIEAFGPFGMPIHGHPASYSADKIFICYEVGLGNNYVTIPIPGIETDVNVSHEAAYLYYQFAHKVPPVVPLFIEDKRVDEIYGEEHRRIIAEYHRLEPEMRTRYLQEDGLSVIWHGPTGDRTLLWNFVGRTAALPGRVTDLSTGNLLPEASTYTLHPMHTYAIEDAAFAVVCVSG